MEGTIEIEGMEFYAFHGCFEAEQIVGNKFIVNASVRYDCGEAAQSDRIGDALNYQSVYEIIAGEMMKASHLLEHVAHRMIEAIYASFSQAIHVKIKISKLNPPIGGKVGCTSLTLEK